MNRWTQIRQVLGLRTSSNSFNGGAESLLRDATKIYEQGPRLHSGDVSVRILADRLLHTRVGQVPLEQWEQLAQERLALVPHRLDDHDYSEKLALAVGLSDHPNADERALQLLLDMLPEATELQAGLGTLRYRIARGLYRLIERGVQPTDTADLWLKLRELPKRHPRFGSESTLWLARVRALIAPRRVFIIHGHQHDLRDGLSQWLEERHAEPVVLSEQVDQGMTLIEKLERNADCVFAIALLTRDDEARRHATTEPLVPRARQNVIFELGMFLALLGRPRVRMLKAAGIEIPSDIAGIAHSPCESLDEPTLVELERELRAAGVLLTSN